MSNEIIGIIGQPLEIIGQVTASGPQGPEGLDAYEVWLAQGNIGTIDDFFTSLKGPKGDPGEVTQAQLKVVADDLSQHKTDYLTQSDIKGTIQSITFNTDGTVQKVEHKDSLNVIIRTDTFVYESNFIIETRTLATGEKITYKNNLNTMEMEVV